MHRPLILAAMMAVSACVPATTTSQPGKPYRLSAAMISTVQADVRRVMKDPDSARFGDIAAAVDSDGIVTICGFVNGRNSFGGYTGALPFMGVYAQSANRFMVADIADAGNASIVVQVCRNQGIAI